jgi:hypothetical protein
VERRKRERREFDMWVPPSRGSHVIKTACQNHPMVKKMNGFKSWMAKDFWFSGSMAKNRL